MRETLTINERILELRPEHARTWLSSGPEIRHLPAEQFIAAMLGKGKPDVGVIHRTSIGLRFNGKWFRLEVPQWVLQWRKALVTETDPQAALNRVTGDLQ